MKNILLLIDYESYGDIEMLIELIYEMGWIWLSAVITLVSCVCAAIPIEIATDIVLFLFVTSIVIGIKNIDN